jgi:hypothetical protein
VEVFCEHGNGPSGTVKCWRNSCVDERLATCQEGLSSMELVIMKVTKLYYKSLGVLESK